MATNFSMAARRQWTDGASLEQAGRGGSADHLYGFAAECALKAILVGFGVIPVAGPSKKSPYKVHIDRLWDEFVVYMSAQGHSSYLPSGTINPFADWLAEHRYEEDATFTLARVQAHAQGARAASLLLEQAIVDGFVR